MFRFSSFALLFCLVLLSSSLEAQTVKQQLLTKVVKDKVFFVSESLADCAGIFYTLSDVLTVLKKPNAALTNKELGNGYLVVSAYNLYVLKLINDWKNANMFAEQRASVKKNILIGLVDLDKSKNKANSLKMLTREFKNCHDTWGKYQAEEMTKIRRELYQLKSEGK